MQLTQLLYDADETSAQWVLLLSQHPGRWPPHCTALLACYKSSLVNCYSTAGQLLIKAEQSITA
jgi:hypothetical protein